MKKNIIHKSFNEQGLDYLIYVRKNIFDLSQLHF